MIKYNLVCQSGHEFDSWFTNSAAFEPQTARGLVACPSCGSTHVEKAPMAPNVSTRAAREAGDLSDQQLAIRTRMAKLREMVLANSEDVGQRFADEARKIHYEEAETRAIHGQATCEEARDLCEEGIGILPLPALPGDKN